MTAAALTIDVDQAARHLARLTGAVDGNTVTVIFQSFDDQKARGKKSLARSIHGTLHRCAPQLNDLQKKGAGVFVTVSEMAGKRRRNTDVAAMRAVFKEDDTGTCLDPPLDPHLVIESSPGKRHLYYLTHTTDKQAWSAVQATMVERFGSDPNAKDLARVLRLAGSWHLKDPGNMHQVRILECNNAPIYSWSAIEEAIPPLHAGVSAVSSMDLAASSSSSADFTDPETIRELRSALCHLDRVDRTGWVKIGHALKTLGETGFELFEEYSRRSATYERDGFRGIWDGFEPTAIDHRAVFTMAAECEWANPRSKRATSPTKFVPAIRSADAILKMEIPDMVWVVREIIAQGVTLLVASPKIGKSWLALQVSLAVAAGTSVLGHRATQGKILFLGLEDGDRRLKDRLLKLGADELPEAARRNLQFETQWPRVDQGGIEHIDSWLAANPEARLVVIDVLQKIRPPRSAKGNLYDEDYEAMRRLKELSEKYRIAILVIHHTRKSSAEDVLETVSGSQGLTGAADAALILKRPRGEEGAELHVTGRDLPSEGYYVVTFSKESCKWSMVGPANEVAPTKERAEIVDLLRDGAIRSPNEIALETGKSRANIAKMLRKMRDDGLVMQVGRGKYSLTTMVTMVTNGTMDTINP